ncbi:gem-associated protein 5-like [Haliotis rufescens]|uniref:gem-associated protein 5-like n=1 Tax=Haliotis rufescens TaxID=6454 RepID=UPI00201EA830|nr:gem-associated protein 5-like [Haliotis rufescens]
MASLVLPASPNWYLSQISDSNRGGFYVFGARHDVAIFDTSSVPRTPPRYINSFCGHKDRVSCVKLGQIQSQLNICCSSADDLKVKLWDVNTQVEIQSHSEHKDKITALSWSRSQTDLIVTGDERGTVVVWRYRTDEHQTFRHEKDLIFSLACCPHDPSLLAVGYKSGNILLLDMSSRGYIQHRLRGHDDEVHSVVWCPVPGENVLTEGAYSEAGDDTEGYLLASGSRDRTIRIWKSSQGKQLQVKKLPLNTGNRRDNADSQGRSKVWTSLYWPLDHPTQLVSSSFGGELVMWDLSPVGHKREIFQAGDSRIHSRIVFNICAGGEEMNTLFTVGMDRMIVLWDLDRQCSVYSIPSLGGHVYNMETSPLDPGRVAVGVGDNTIRVWNTNNKVNPFDINTLWQGIKSKVTSLCWHPTKEGQLAFGTDHGSVGIYDVMTNKHPNVSSTFHRRTVYVVAFGPASRSAEAGESSSLSLYSVGDSMVLEHRPHAFNKDAVDINQLIEQVNGKRSHSQGRTDICWKPDNSVVAIASDDGSVEICQSGTFKLLCVVQVHRKLINCLKWHPQFTADKPLGSDCRHWLASGASDALVNVVDLSSTLDSVSEGVASLTDSIRRLEGHSIRVTAISWNPHVEGQMVSVGYDSMAYVWNVKTGEAMYQFEGHIQRLLAVTWSGTDPDEVMSGGFDSMLHRWKVSSLPKAVIETGKKKKKKKKSHSVNTDGSLVSSKGSSPTVFEVADVTEGESNDSFGSDAKGHNWTDKQNGQPQENLKATEGDWPSENVDAAGRSKQAHEGKRPKERKKLDFQDELAELREMLEMRKKQILKEQQQQPQSQQTSQPLKASQQHSKSQQKAPRTATRHDGSMQELTPGVQEDGDEEGLSREENLSDLIQEGLTTNLPWEDTPTSQRCVDDAENRETAANILGTHYLSSKSKGDYSSVRDTSSKRDSSLRESSITSRKRRTRAKSFFPVSAKEENRGKSATLEDLLLLTRLKTADQDADPHVQDDDSVHLGLFTDRRGTYRCLNREGEYHLNNDSMDYAIQMEIWKGNIGGALQIATDREELSDWLVGLAPLASYDTWLGMCEEYARQLEGDGQYHKATSYLLACHKVYEAIDLFKRHRLFKEAVALARMRLSPLDPVLEDLYMEWAQMLMKDGNYEQAAKCYLAMKQIQDAANLLTKRTDQSSLKTATHMTLLANEKPQGFLYAHRLVHQFIAKDDWKQGYKFLKEHETLKMLLPFVSMHELLLRELQSLTPGTLREVDPACFTEWGEAQTGKAFIPDFILDVTECDPVLPWKPYMIGEHSFPHHVLKVWSGNLDIGMDSESLTLTYRTLQQLQSGRQSHIDPQQLMFQVCMDLTLSLLAVLLGETASAINHLLHGVSTLHTVGQLDLMEAVCQLMLPLGPKYLLKLQQEATALRVLISMEAHLEVEGSGKAPSLKRYLTDIKEDDSVSTSGLRCRELDCLRAYYYLAILHYLKNTILEDSLTQGQTAEASVDDDFKVQANVDLEQLTLRESDNPVEGEGQSASGQSGQSVVLSRSQDSSKVKSESEPAISSDDQGQCIVQGEGQSVSVGQGQTDIPTDSKEISEDVSKANAGCEKDVSVLEGASGTNVDGAQGGQSALDKDSIPSESHDQRDVSKKCQTADSVQLLSITKLKQISRGLLWDIQAKKHSLTETLGYIHKAISKHLLADKSKDHQSRVFKRAPQQAAGGENNNNGFSSSGDATENTGSSQAGDGGSAQAASPSSPSASAHSTVPNGLKDGLAAAGTVASLCNPLDPSDIELVSFSGTETFAKSRKVLWEDEPHNSESVDSRPRKASCVLNPAKYINVPDEWYGMPVDEKYFRPYVTMAVLKEEQEYVMHELKRVPDSSVVSFPNPFDSVKVLLDVCRLCPHLDGDSKNAYNNLLVLWALHFAVTSHQRRELSKLIKCSPEKESQV